MQKEAEGYGLKSQIKLIFHVCACERLIFHSTQSFFLQRALVIGGLVSCDLHVHTGLIFTDREGGWGGLATHQYHVIQPNDEK